MNVSVDIWLRGDNHATTVPLPSVTREPGAWTEDDVAEVLTGMLRAMDKAHNPDSDPDRPVALRGFSWIVSPFEAGGVVIALELSLGAAVAGPFDIAERDLTKLIQKVVDAARMPPSSSTVH
ncbi:MAG TPA: hypothetical protein VGQ37_10840 [Vicinamibacterales bacterium]|jgi:hypothetical protein|nr:hypothetical protein [Vicinamibacterales bacterium]